MLTLTTPIAIPNVTRLRVKRVDLDDDTSTAYVHVEVLGAGGSPPIYETHVLEIHNGSSFGLRATVSPAKFTDRVERFTVSTATGFTALLAAYAGATLAIRNRAAETQGVTSGWLPAGTVA